MHHMLDLCEQQEIKLREQTHLSVLIRTQELSSSRWRTRGVVDQRVAFSGKTNRTASTSKKPATHRFDNELIRLIPCELDLHHLVTNEPDACIEQCVDD